MNSGLAAGLALSPPNVNLGDGNIALGRWSRAGRIGPVTDVDDAISIGRYALANATSGIAIGGGPNTTSAPMASGTNSIAIGAGGAPTIFGARALGATSIAIGGGTSLFNGASATGSSSIALGWISQASGSDSIAIGTGSASTIQHGIAIGHSAQAATGTNTIAIGAGSSSTTAAGATGLGGISIGATTGATGPRASGSTSIALGSGDASIAGALASAADAIAFGRGSSAAHSRATAIGQGATTTAVNQIMLGTATEQVYIPGTVRIPTGAAVGSVLTSDVNGVGTWSAPASATALKTPVRLASAGANVVVATGGLVVVDGVTTVAGDRVLLKDQTTPAENGIYVAAVGAWTRATDADVSAEVIGGMQVLVTQGTTNADTEWILSTNDPITLGTTGLTFIQQVMVSDDIFSLAWMVVNP